MTVRRLPMVLALLLWAVAASFGQGLAPEQRQRVLDRLQQTVATRAFVPGVDFERWPEFLARHQSAVEPPLPGVPRNSGRKAAFCSSSQRRSSSLWQVFHA